MSFTDGVAFALALDWDFAGAAAVVSITDALVFLGEVGAGFVALLVFAAGLLATGGVFAGVRAGAALATETFFADFVVAADFLTVEAAGTFFDAAAFFATGFDLTDTAAFFVADFVATGLALAFTLDTFALVGAIALGFAAGLARAGALVDLAVDLVFFMIFAISVLTL